MSEEEDLIEPITPATFNKKDKVAEKKPFNPPKPINITQVIADKLEKRDEERCERCGHLKVKISSRRNWDGNKFVWRCTFCANKRRVELRAEKREKSETK